MKNIHALSKEQQDEAAVLIHVKLLGGEKYLLQLYPDASSAHSQQLEVTGLSAFSHIKMENTEMQHAS